MTAAPLGVSYDDILAAQDRMGRNIRTTPLLNAPLLDRIAGREVWVKAEALQLTGSFKARGGWSAISALPKDCPGVLAMSSGNHAQGVAWAAARHQMPAVILMPSDAPAVKIANTRAYGAEVVLYDRTTEDRDALASMLAQARGLTLVAPFDDRQVIAGQGSIGLEIGAQMPEQSAMVLVPCGGGGMSSGIGLALAQVAPQMQMMTVEPEGFDDMARSLETGQPVRNAKTTGSICDAILTPTPGLLTLPILQSLQSSGRLAGGLRVSDAQAKRAMALAFTHLRLVLEPGGAVALAAALFNPDLPRKVIAVASGGNVDPALFAEVLRADPL